MIKNLSVIFLLFVGFLFAQNRQANDCVNYIQICSNASISLNPMGYGIQELDKNTNVCESQENNSIWIRFTVKTTGTLGFDLIPDDPDINVDYDFWIFGPNVTCGNLGTSVRCSTTNPAAAFLLNNHTGLRDSEPGGDFFEGPGKLGDGYIKSLDVQAGESYFLVIDRPAGDGAFSLNWTGTALLDDPFSTAPFAFGTIPDFNFCKANTIFDFLALGNQILNGNPDFSVYFYETYEDATYDENRMTGPIELQDKSYYYRIQSDKTECFQVKEIKVTNDVLSVGYQELKACDLNGLGSFDLKKINVPGVQSLEFYKTETAANQHLTGTEINKNILYNSPSGQIWGRVENAQGCDAVFPIDLLFYPKPNLDTSKISTVYCDEDFDGEINLKLSDITPKIVAGSSDFNVKYYLQSNPSVELSDDFTFTVTTNVVVVVESKDSCPSVSGKLVFSIGPPMTIVRVPYVEVCNNKYEAAIEVDLDDYKSQFTTAAQATYFATRNDANLQQSAISNLQKISGDKSFFIRFENGQDCPVVVELKLKMKFPNKSTVLKDEIVCIGDKTVLDAGVGFDDYEWQDGKKSRYSSVLPAGEYWVDLSSNGCVYRQYVKVIEEEIIVIKKIIIDDHSITVEPIGGSQPYQYSLDKINWQTSNIFHNLPKGISTIYVKSALDCEPVARDFAIIEMQNVITPNADGINDAVDYSALKLKLEPKMQIIDRFGKIVYSGEDKKYIWGGRFNGHSVPTGTYWYIIEWTEPDTGLRVEHKSWVVVKNRN